MPDHLKEKRFIKYTAICGLITVITTLGIHLFFPEVPADFEQRALLYQNTLYIFQRFWIILHCLLAMIAAWGMYILLRSKHSGWAGLGLFFYILFGVTEIARQLLVLFYLNGLRERYVQTTEAAYKTFLKFELDQAGLFSLTLFGLFILAFGLANLFYALSLWQEKGYTKLLSVLLLIWSAGSLMAFSNEFLHHPQINSFLKNFNAYFQPTIRAMMAWWVWRQLNNDLDSDNKSFVSLP